MSPVNFQRCSRTVDADVLMLDLTRNRVELAVVVVGEAVELVDGDVELVGPFDEVEPVDTKRTSPSPLSSVGLELFEVGVGAVAADAVAVEDPKAERRSPRRLVGA